MSEIIEGSKTIAKYLGWVYIPSNDLRGFPKAGWFHVEKPRIEKVTVTRTKYQQGSEVEFLPPIEKEMNVTNLRCHPKSGWSSVGENKVKFVCRNHNQLRFYNSFDSLIPAIEKIENEDLSEFHYEWKDGRGEHNNFQSIEFNRWGDESFYDVGLELDPSYYIGRHKGEGIIKDTFHATVEAINYINNLKVEN